MRTLIEDHALDTTEGNGVHDVNGDMVAAHIGTPADLSAADAGSRCLR